MLLKLLLFVAVLCVLLRRSSKRKDTADAALLGHFWIRGRTIKSCKIFWCKIGFRMSVMRSCENIVNGNHVTFFLHSIGLKFFDVEYDWSKNVEINRFKFSYCAVCFCSKLCFFENDQTYLFKKTKSCSLLCPDFNNKMKTKKVEEEQITLGKQVCFLFSSLKSYSR